MTEVTRGEKTLDFIVVGAAKAGTTALFEYLRTHPEVALPREKEIGFFAVDELFDRGWGWYARSFLGKGSAGRTCGEVSPAYMWGTPHSGKPLHAPRTPAPGPQPPGSLERVVPERIGETLPDVKVIAVLRDPVERAVSHYQMSRLWGWERRDLDNALEELLAPARIEESRRWITGTSWYLALGEYGRILAPYFDIFPRKQIRVVFSQDLLSRRGELLRELFAFIGVDADWAPPNLDVRYRRSATARRVPALDLYRWRDSLAGVGPLRTAWRSLPKHARDPADRLYGWATFRLDMWNAKRGDRGPELGSAVRAALEHHFRTDGRVLASLIGRKPPWLEAWEGVPPPRDGDPFANA